MDKYYYISAPTFGGSYKKMNYTQVIKYLQTSTNAVFKVLKSDYQTIEKGIKGVILQDKVKFIFNRLHSERKTSRF